MLITIPGVQKPHCMPWLLAERLLDGVQLAVRVGDALERW